jgi:hypothetical protein
MIVAKVVISATIFARLLVGEREEVGKMKLTRDT